MTDKIEWGSWNDEQIKLLTDKYVDLIPSFNNDGDTPAIFNFNHYKEHRVLINFTLKGFLGAPGSPEIRLGVAHYCPEQYDEKVNRKDNLWNHRFDQLVSVAVATPNDFCPSGRIERYDFYGKDFDQTWNEVKRIHKKVYPYARIPAIGKKKAMARFDYCCQQLDQLVSVLD